ncbi:unnamed protein product [Effrenium voratum]|nr:unnamed protein product [Effrenium voratum]
MARANGSELGKSVRQATAMARQFDLEDTMRAWQGFLRFSKENRSFYMAVRNQVQRQVASLCSSQLLLVQRAARDLHSCADLHAAACAEIQRRLPKLALSEAAACLAHCTFKREFRPQASALVRAVVQHWNERQDLHDLKVVEVVDALVCLASWDLRPPVLGAALKFSDHGWKTYDTYKANPMTIDQRYC